MYTAIADHEMIAGDDELPDVICHGGGILVLKDRYGMELSTASPQARDAFVQGLDCLIGGDAGTEEALETSVDHDPQFAMGYLALARAKQALGKANEASEPLARAREYTSDASTREASAIDALGLLIEGKGALAYPKIRSHVSEYPRDVLVAQTCTSVFGLIGFSGMPGREAEQLAYTTSLEPHYGDDWWFLSQHAFAQMEVGQLEPARRTIERSMEINPDPAHVVHVRAHLFYECGETKEGLEYIRSYQANLERSAQMHCHISWHMGLWALETGDLDTLWKVVDDEIAPGVSSSPPLNVLSDTAALLARAELLGIAVDPIRWKGVSAYASERFPETGIAFADVHAALAHAMAGEGAALEKIVRDARGPAADIVSGLASGFGAFARGEWDIAVSEFVSVMPQHERIGGSRAQRDLIEYALASALLRLGRGEEANRLLAMHRPNSPSALKI